MDNASPVSQAETLAQAVCGQSFTNHADVVSWITSRLSEFDAHPALFGGVELALWNLACQTIDIPFDTLLGPVYERTLGRCVTVGFDTSTRDLRRTAIDARLKGATVIKLKIGLEDDIDRVHQLDAHLKGKLPLRLDANALYELNQLETLLDACAGMDTLHSIEEPFNLRTRPELADELRSLHTSYGVAFMADESVCSLSEAKRWCAEGCFQMINLRVGKHGGLLASVAVRNLATEQGLGLVSGSMVGETGVLTQASELLLSRSTQFHYVEGLGQNTDFLTIDPVDRVGGEGAMKALRFNSDQCSDLIVKRISFH